MNTDEWKERLPLVQAFVDGAVIEYYNRGEWEEESSPDFYNTLVYYRIKPKPRDIWVNEYGDFYGVHKSVDDAKVCASDGVTRTAVHYREVLENE